MDISYSPFNLILYLSPSPTASLKRATSIPPANIFAASAISLVDKPISEASSLLISRLTWGRFNSMLESTSPSSGVSASLLRKVLMDSFRILRSGPDTVNCMASPLVPEANDIGAGNAFIPGILLSLSLSIGMSSYCLYPRILLGVSLT